MLQVRGAELKRVAEYLRASADGGRLKFPVKRVAGLLLDEFGWPETEGKIRANAILEELEKQEQLVCLRDKGGKLRGVQFSQPESTEIKEEKRAETLEPAIGRESQGSQSALAPEVEFSVTSAPIAPPKKPRPKFKARKKGVARRLREAREKGDRNERKAFLLINNFLEAVKKVLGKKVVVWRCYQTGNHRPKLGKIDWRDKSGEDVGGELLIAWNGGLIGGRFIYQVKSSFWIAERFNQHLKILPGQEGALFKKAIWFNSAQRPLRDFAEEVLSDFVGAGLSMLAEHKEKLFRILSV